MIIIKHLVKVVNLLEKVDQILKAIDLKVNWEIQDCIQRVLRKV